MRLHPVSVLALPRSEKKEISQLQEELCESRIHEYADYEEYLCDEEDIVSIPEISISDKMKLCSYRWRTMNDEVRKAWKERVLKVNRLPILGQFTKLPDSLEKETNKILLEVLNREIDTVAMIFRRKLMKQTKISMKKKKFGNEEIVLNEKVFLKLNINLPLMLTLFGSNLSLFNENEIMERKKKSYLIHLSTIERINNIFQVEGRRLLELSHNDWKKVACPKIIFKYKNDNKVASGYVTHYNNINKRNMVLMDNGDSIGIVLPGYDVAKGSWVQHCNDDISIEEFHPLRMKLLKSGILTMTFHTFKLSN